MKKKAPRKNWRTTHYGGLDVLFASATEPLPKGERLTYLTKVYEALHSIQTGESPTREDWQLCIDAVNIMTILVTEMNVCADEDGLIDDAANALARARKRFFETGKIRFDGQGLAAVRAVVEDYSTCIETFPARIMIQAHRTMQLKIQEMYGAKTPKVKQEQ